MKRQYKVINQIPALMVNNKTNSADINIYGPIVESSWWSDNVTTPKSIQDKLASLGNVNQIDVHINSPGGSVFAGQAIYNMLRQHPANVTVYVDGLAASIASVIAMAGNKIVMPPGTMMMIHDPLLSLWGSYQAGDMREMADFLDKVKESLVATYTSRNAKKSKDEIVALMAATTWLTAADAVEHGFADEIDGGEVTANMTGKVLNIAGMAFDLSPFETMPLNILPAATVPTAPVVNKNEEESILNLQELKAKFPDLYNELLNLGVTQERSRMKAIDEVQIGGFEDIVNKARYETGATAEQVAVQIIAAQKQQGSDYLKNLQQDTADSNLTQVPAASTPAAKEQEEKEIKAAADQIAAGANERRKQ